MTALPGVRALVFDVFGTVVDWRYGVARDARNFLARHGRKEIDPHAFADALIANERLKSQAAREKKKSALDTDITDLVLGGAEALWQLLRR